jgi:hypothetical protein
MGESNPALWLVLFAAAAPQCTQPLVQSLPPCGLSIPSLGDFKFTRTHISELPSFISKYHTGKVFLTKE